MSDSAAALPPTAAVLDRGAATDVDRSFFGHPRGLATLFFTEMWERFSYYGMRAFLILYMTAPAAAGGLGFGDARAASIYGTYTGSAWGASILGGLVADRFIGQYRSVLLGGIIIALGHGTLAFKSLPAFYTGLGLIVLGTGLLKPNVSTLVGSLYAPGDTRRDAGFSLFYMGINLGAFIGPLVAGYLAQRVDWHLGFASAGIGMMFGVTQYVLGRKRLQTAMARLDHAPAATSVSPARRAPADGAGFTSDEWRRIGAIVIFFLAAVLFWGAYEQAGSTLNLFAERSVDNRVLGHAFPASWYQALTPFFIITLAPVFALLWVRLGRRDPSSPIKFTIALVMLGLGFALMVGAASAALGGARVSPLWLVLSYLLQTTGELCLSPVGLSAMSRLAPVRIAGLIMGVWYLSISVGNYLAGMASSVYETMPLPTLFGLTTAMAFSAALVLALLVRPIRRMLAH